MDGMTEQNQNWLDERFRATDDQGVYYAHQPIYGFRQQPCEPGMVSRYVITYHIMQALARLRFDTLLDVGGAEGYKAALARSLFGAQVKSVDLSAEACKRAMDIFKVEGESVDIHHLPYADGEFDVVMCSETLEHVQDYRAATKELLRVARKAVVITVPRESREVVERNIALKEPHGHIHALDLHSFDFALPDLKRIESEVYHNPPMSVIGTIADAMPRGMPKSFPPFLVAAYNRMLPLVRCLFSENSIAPIIGLDAILSKRLSWYAGMVFVLVKDETSWCAHAAKVPARDIVRFKVERYRLR